MPEDSNAPKFYTVQVAIVDGEGYIIEVASLHEGYNLEKAKVAFHDVVAASPEVK